jgi:long-chain acyl-CoA synthetase
MATLLDMFFEQSLSLSEKIALKTKIKQRWHDTSWRVWLERSKKIADGLISLGVEPHHRIAIISETRQEWVETDMGILLARAITVPIYPSLTSKQSEHILTDSETKIVFVQDPIQAKKIFQFKNLKILIYFDQIKVEKDGSQIEINQVIPKDFKGKVISYGELMIQGQNNPSDLKARAKEVDPHDIATIVYTSGTTGTPKGAMISHDNLVYICSTLKDLFELGPEDSQLLFLPLAHIFARIVYLSALKIGYTLIFAQDMNRIIEDAKETSPTFMCAVPRFFEKVYERFMTKQKQAPKWKRMLLDYSLKIGKEKSLYLQKKEQPPLSLALKSLLMNILVYKKIKALFGGKLKFMISGGAPLRKDILEFFHSLNLLILEGYGLTETSSVVSVNTPKRYKFGTVGRPIEGTKIAIEKDGEIKVQSRSVMKGYFKNEEETKKVIDPKGWLYTGDIGEIDEQGFLKITDRKKDILVTAGGKNIFPQTIENELKKSRYINEVMIYGDKRKYLVALVTLNKESIEEFALSQGISQKFEELVQTKLIKDTIAKEINKANKKLAPFETIKDFRIIATDFTLEAAEITPTLKIKRNVIAKRYKNLIEEMYSEK